MPTVRLFILRPDAGSSPGQAQQLVALPAPRDCLWFRLRLKPHVGGLRTRVRFPPVPRGVPPSNGYGTSPGIRQGIVCCIVVVDLIGRTPASLAGMCGFDSRRLRVCDQWLHDRFAGTPLGSTECQQWLTNKTSPGSCSSIGRATVSKTVGCRFESCQLRNAKPDGHTRPGSCNPRRSPGLAVARKRKSAG